MCVLGGLRGFFLHACACNQVCVCVCVYSSGEDVGWTKL